MDRPTPPTDLLAEDFLHHGAWLRRLANALVVDGHDVDDVLQEAWLAVSCSRSRPEPPTRAWYAGVVRNLVRNGRRAAERTRRRERLAASRVELQQAVESTKGEDRLARGQALIELLQELPRAQREAIIARYFDGLSPAAIARREGLGVAGVKSRLKRGLATLRERLEQRHGGAQGLAIWLAPLSRATRSPARRLAGLLVCAVSVGIGVKTVATGVREGVGVEHTAALPPPEPLGTPRARATERGALPSRLDAAPIRAQPDAQPSATSAEASSVQAELRLTREAQVGVPTCVRHCGGPTIVGTSLTEAERIAPDLGRAFVNALHGETPAAVVQVEPYWLGRHELTIAEYRRFLVAMDRTEPAEWPRDWSDRSQQQRPAALVSYHDAVAYCEWAGVRLPTEAEFCHAARGSTSALYPWGEAWVDSTFAITSESRLPGPQPVGSCPNGASANGVHDLIGNVWEWTSTRYEPFAGFAPHVYTLHVDGRREEVAAPGRFRVGTRVLKGGWALDDRWVARIGARRGAMEREKATGVGFRVAASTRACLDSAVALHERLLRAAVPDLVLAPGVVVGIDRWTVGEIGILGYERVFFLPAIQRVERGAAATLGDVRIGVLSTSLALRKPELAAGDYVVARCSRGDSRVDPELMAGLDAAQDWLLFLRLQDGTRAAATPAPGKVRWGEPHATPTVAIPAGHGSRTAPNDHPNPMIELHAVLPVASSDAPLVLPIRLGLAPDAAGAAWRCP